MHSADKTQNFLNLNQVEQTLSPNKTRMREEWS
jgi:hypothetical protein